MSWAPSAVADKFADEPQMPTTPPRTVKVADGPLPPPPVSAPTALHPLYDRRPLALHFCFAPDGTGRAHASVSHGPGPWPPFQARPWGRALARQPLVQPPVTALAGALGTTLRPLSPSSASPALAPSSRRPMSHEEGTRRGTSTRQMRRWKSRCHPAQLGAGGPPIFGRRPPPPELDGPWAGPQRHREHRPSPVCVRRWRRTLRSRSWRRPSPRCWRPFMRWRPSSRTTSPR